jgi:acetyl-CoA carboxylase biotin carboxyl carrier protein
MSSIRPRRELLVAATPDGAEVLASPGPGRVHWVALAGATLVEGSVAGQFIQSERVFDLVLPAGVHGQLREVLAPNPWTSCAHGAPLAVLGAVEAAPLGTPDHQAASASGTLAVRAPSHGTFYRRPAPGTPVYVEPGQTVARGAVLGLVEVMKCFSPIAFDPPVGIEQGRVAEVLSEDGTEVRSDQVLMRIELVR